MKSKVLNVRKNGGASMQKVCEFLKNAEVYYLATVEGDQPRVRPFGTAHIFEGKLYIQTGKVKPVSRQLAANPKAEICAFKDGVWLRVAGEMIALRRRNRCWMRIPTCAQCTMRTTAIRRCCISSMLWRRLPRLQRRLKRWNSDGYEPRRSFCLYGGET